MPTKQWVVCVERRNNERVYKGFWSLEEAYEAVVRTARVWRLSRKPRIFYGYLDDRCW
jgi:hypothetical protein